ncbi:Demethylrebeccamycin-D-glucose O-methyltransferase [Fundidesulfovibrio magnetotacticus]|uniref:Demethylrebeccamycin-D-glucose O-methyltransferase n=1 Tax=Fundidesulfovibrio magnetotacticus TaxID=2730080 RepID=A0A6V8LVD8_9BACT|nr:methyltransferase domain-containing protein [Fundidesulfovibrio magnetotacticus]GFK93786.1 Demethylrebeccamycin-D-glucose O-methyltransferase [Fundidesulfovibrio magnetotacticus]
MTMDTPFTDKYDKAFLLDAMMGPNAMRIMEEMAHDLPLSPGMRVLDLGCGMGISSILLAEKFDVTVFAADLWIAPAENAKRFASLGLGSQIFPFLVDATQEIPFAQDSFDMILSVDAYQYFGANETMLPKLLPLVKPGGHVAVAVPGFNQDFPEGGLPPEIRPYWTPEWYFYSPGWWRALWAKEPGLEITVLREMDSCQQAWDEWLKSPNPYAQGDRAMMDAGAGKYFNIIQLVGRKV